MKIAKAHFVDPERNFGYGFVAVAISIFVFAYSTRFGQGPILVYYALWLPLVLIDYRHSLGNYARFQWVIAFGVLACLSTFWSNAPGVTGRASLQYMSHAVCALIAARTISIRTLTLGTIAGVLLVVLFSLAFGQYRYDPIDGDYSFIGAFSSKNLLGFFSSVGIYFSLAALFILRERGPWRLLALACLGIAGYALAICSSATSVIATATTLAMMVGLGVVLMFAPGTRKAFFVAGIVMGIGIALIAANAGGFDALLGAFGKDSTLTGRTYLWGEGIAAAKQAPLLGVGYQGYWVQDFPDAERLWEEFYIDARSGFHFHETYVEVAVELGLVGLALIVVMMLRVFAGHLLRLLDDRRDAASAIMFGMAAMLLVRSFFEVDVIHPYAVGSFLLVYAAGLLAARRRPVGRRRPRPALRPHHA